MTALLHTLPLPTEAHTRTLAAQLARLLLPGDTVLLSGPIGSGKSAFARAFIRARLRNPAEDVPSPTFTLVQTYEHAQGDIWHCDFYRLGHPDDVLELGLDEAFDNAICLIEWPDRLGSLAPQEALSIEMAASENGHSARLSGPVSWRDRIAGIAA